jgi:propionyl-CoA carboxylase alpha chain
MPTTTYTVAFGERSVRVQVRRDGDVAFVRIGDADEQRAELRGLHGALYSLSVGQERMELAAVPKAGEVRVVLHGIEYLADVVDEAHARLASVAGGRSASHAHVELKAPMPGLLVRLLCSVGDEVQPGQPLAVLQAMKMENELSLPRGGKVSKVAAEAGQTVEQNQVLVVLE